MPFKPTTLTGMPKAEKRKLIIQLLTSAFGDVDVVAANLNCSRNLVNRYMRTFNLFSRNFKEAYVRRESKR